ncbi:MAG TPA: PEGA domain-containing protein [Leptospiraceae bacterium]|nr:PEGA domain-containing protein [Leptospiraceae bacterium]HNM05260.1 PEGA domain-containing protein [Leptospiraceae bacterium]HNN05988.1 PEGA domain-containing protein [Leptospiraceae bacterium]HNO26683.1 PEGA domain-containing protein [Leptospiraceae bacterium]
MIYDSELKNKFFFQPSFFSKHLLLILIVIPFWQCSKQSSNTAVILSDPKGAQVFSEKGELLGNTPLLLKNISRTKMDIKLKKEGFAEKAVSVEFTENENIVMKDVSLVDPRNVKILSSEKGDEIEVFSTDETWNKAEFYGLKKTPIYETFPPGNYMFRYRDRTKSDAKIFLAVKSDTPLYERKFSSENSAAGMSVSEQIQNLKKCEPDSLSLNSIEKVFSSLIDTAHGKWTAIQEPSDFFNAQKFCRKVGFRLPSRLELQKVYSEKIKEVLNCSDSNCDVWASDDGNTAELGLVFSLKDGDIENEYRVKKKNYRCIK